MTLRSSPSERDLRRSQLGRTRRTGASKSGFPAEARYWGRVNTQGDFEEAASFPASRWAGLGAALARAVRRLAPLAVPAFVGALTAAGLLLGTRVFLGWGPLRTVPLAPGHGASPAVHPAPVGPAAEDPLRQPAPMPSAAPAAVVAPSPAAAPSAGASPVPAAVSPPGPVLREPAGAPVAPTTRRRWVRPLGDVPAARPEPAGAPASRAAAPQAPARPRWVDPDAVLEPKF